MKDISKSEEVMIHLRSLMVLHYPSIEVDSNLRKIGEKAVNPLIAMLNAPDWKTRRWAAHGLGQLGSYRAVVPLIEAMDDQENQVRTTAAVSLGLLHASEAVETLIEKVQDLDISIRDNSIYALGLIGDSRAIPVLLNALDDSHLSVRSAAVVALGRLRAKEAIPQLIQIFKENSNPLIPHEAVCALGEIGEPATSYLLNALSAADKETYPYIIQALGKVGDKRATDTIIAALAHPDKNVRQQSAAALGQLGGKTSVKPLLTVLNDPENIVRVSAVQSLGLLKSKSAINPLILALQDEDPTVRANVAEVLGKLGDKRVAPKLLTMLNDKAIADMGNPLPVRFEVIIALGELHAENAVSDLLPLLQDTDDDIRWAVVKSLGMIGDYKALQYLRLVATQDAGEVSWGGAMVSEAASEAIDLIEMKR